MEKKYKADWRRWITLAIMIVTMALGVYSLAHHMAGLAMASGMMFVFAAFIFSLEYRTFRRMKERVRWKIRNAYRRMTMDKFIVRFSGLILLIYSCVGLRYYTPEVDVEQNAILSFALLLSFICLFAPLKHSKAR